MTHDIRNRGRAILLGSVLCSVVLATALLGTASSGATERAPQKATVGVTANQIILGTTTPLTGPAAPGYDEIAPAANAVFQYVNAHGGVYNRKIKYIIDNDEYYPPLTVSLTRQLVEQDNIFADVGPLGTPTQLAVQPYLNSQGIPQLFVESGCACWTQAKYPDSFGWQPNYIIEGKILGKYVVDHMSGKKIGYLYQDDEFGLDGVKGLNQEIPKGSVVGEQNYQGTSQGLAAGLGTQMSALKADGAKVVVLYSIPAATALALLAAAGLGYHPQWVVSSVGADPPTLAGLLGSFSKGAAGASLLNGMISNAYLPPETDASNAWIKLSKSILSKYDKGYHWDGNSEYGIALGITTVEALEAAGKNLTRAGLLKAIESDGRSFATPGLVPLSYTKSDHYGFSGSEVVQVSSKGSVITPVSPVYVSSNLGPIKTYTGGTMPIPPMFK
jgi:ABC-type branched-subunit amino acid transport system substrate-binding protein